MNPKTRLSDLTAKLKARGFRLTPQRLLILRILAESMEHPSIEQLYEHVKAEFPTTSLATVYKTVALLKEMDEVLELGFHDGGSRYDGKRPYPHPHLICTGCGEILDLELAGLSELPQQVAKDTGYRIASHRLDFFGLCPSCQGKR